MNSLLSGLRLYIFDLYVSMRHNVDQSLMEVKKRFREACNCEAMALQEAFL